MNIEKRIEELTADQVTLNAHRQQALADAQQDEMNLHRLAGAIIALRELLAAEEPASNGQHPELEPAGR